MLPPGGGRPLFLCCTGRWRCCLFNGSALVCVTPVKISLKVHLIILDKCPSLKKNPVNVLLCFKYFCFFNCRILICLNTTYHPLIDLFDSKKKASLSLPELHSCTENQSSSIRCRCHGNSERELHLSTLLFFVLLN